MNSERAGFAVRIGFSAAAAVFVLTGASLNAGGRDIGSVALAAVAGLLALAAGVLFRRWRVAALLGVASLVMSVVIAQFNPRQSDLVIQLPGLILVGVGGVFAALAYARFRLALERQVEQIGGLNSLLAQKHRAFVAATTDLDGTAPGDTAAITAAIAGNVGADVACCYLASADGRRWVPQPPGLGVERLRP